MEKRDVQEEIVRVRMPREGEILAVVTALLGGSRMRVSCIDGKERIVRVPGKLKRRAWIKMNDVVLIIPWEIDNSKGDIVWKYTPIQVEWLKNKGVIPRNFG
ncbi:MAG: translation initiation factor eIF-1A [Candidatus Micrarchaeia archaeon]